MDPNSVSSLRATCNCRSIRGSKPSAARLSASFARVRAVAKETAGYLPRPSERLRIPGSPAILKSNLHERAPPGDTTHSRPGTPPTAVVLDSDLTCRSVSGRLREDAIC